MAGCQIHGRLWTEIYNAPLYFLWTQVAHTPAGDSLMQGASFVLIKQRIHDLSGMPLSEINEKAKALRAAKLAQELRDYGGVNPSKNDIYSIWLRRYAIAAETTKQIILFMIDMWSILIYTNNEIQETPCRSTCNA